MAERVVDRCEKRLKRKPNPPPTAEEPLPGGDFAGSVEVLRSRLESLGLGLREAGRAARLYGGEALELFAGENHLAAEVRHAVESEGALTLEDYWVRRSARARFESDDGLAALTDAAEYMGEFMGWSEKERTGQIEYCRGLQAEELSAREAQKECEGESG
jgi:glycerol-3-phosphate dehydrogenase